MGKGEYLKPMSASKRAVLRSIKGRARVNKALRHCVIDSAFWILVEHKKVVCFALNDFLKSIKCSR